MQNEPLRRFVTRSVTGGVPTETVGTIKDIARNPSDTAMLTVGYGFGYPGLS